VPILLRASATSRAKIYVFQAGDAIVLATVAAVACVACVIATIYRKRDLATAHVISITCAAAAVTQVVFNVFFLKVIQVYYLYPVAVLATIALVCFWPVASEGIGAALGLARWMRFCRVGLATILLGIAVLTLPTFALRIYAQNVIPASEWRLMNAMADLPPNSLVLLGFPPEAEMIENSALLLDRVLGRVDLTIEAAFSPSNEARQSEAYVERRPVYLAFVYEPAENVKVGIRGVTQNLRTENLALAASYGIGRICPGPRETVGPWPFKVFEFILRCRLY
jgi:hypothetical protein